MGRDRKWVDGRKLCLIGGWQDGWVEISELKSNPAVVQGSLLMALAVICQRISSHLARWISLNIELKLEKLEIEINMSAAQMLSGNF